MPDLNPNATNAIPIFDEYKRAFNGRGIELRGDVTFATKEESPELMAADFLAHTYSMMLDSGRIDAVKAKSDASARDTRLAYLGFEPDGISDLKTQFERYRQRLNERYLANKYPKSPASLEEQSS